MRFAAILPRKKRVIVTATIGSDQRIFEMDLNGDNQIELTKHGFCYGVNLSPDKKRLAFHMPGGGGYYSINVIDIETKQQIRIAAKPDHLYFMPMWSPDNQWLVYADCHAFEDIAHFRADVCLSKADGSEQRVITQGRPQWFGTTYGSVAYRSGGSDYPRWSPDGKMILFTHLLPNSHPDVYFDPNRPDHQENVYKPELARGGTQLCTINPFTGKITELTAPEESIWIHHPEWSPDGKRIVFSKGKAGCRSELWIMDSDGGNQRFLTKGYKERGVQLGGRWIRVTW
jgi:TolB protein